MGAGDDRLAQHLLCVGGGAHPDRAADQLADAAAGCRREGGRCRRRQAAHSARPHHDLAGVCLRRGVERHRRDGRAFAADSGSRRRDIAAGGGGGRADRSLAGGGAHLRSEFSLPLSPAGVGPAGVPDASDRCRHYRIGRRWRGERVCRLSRHRQRHFDHCPRHHAARDLRSTELRLSPRGHRRTGTDRAGRRPAGVQPANRRHG